MSDAAIVRRRSVHRDVVVDLARSACASAITAVESVFSQRGLVFLGLSLALFITLCTGWLRPPLSRDVGSLELSLGCESEPLLDAEPRFRWGSPGALMLVAIGTGFLLTAGSAQPAAIAGGLVLSGGIVANVTAVLNRPLTVELLQFEYAERQQMASVLQHTSRGDSVTTLSNGRVAGVLTDTTGGQSLLQGWAHLLYGKWLILIGLLLHLFTATARLRRRLLGAAAWILVGAGVSCALCAPRLLAEYCWCRSEQHAAAADYERARAAFTRALDICSPLENLERAWYWAGKLDYLQGRASSYAIFFRAAQLANARQHDESAMLMDNLTARGEGTPPPVQRQHARILSHLGLIHYLGSSTHDLQQTLESRSRLRSSESAVAIWTRALSVQPERKDCLLYRAIALAESTDAAVQVEQDVLRFLAATADRSLQADVLSTLGDVFFEVGQVQRARQYYEKSKRIFELPKDINFRARRGLLGV